MPELISDCTARPSTVSFCQGKNNLILLILTVHSRILYYTHLGLHPYLQNGGRFGLEIQVDFYEGTVLVPTLLNLRRYQFAPSLSV